MVSLPPCPPPCSGYLVRGLHHGRNDHRKNTLQRQRLYPFHVDVGEKHWFEGLLRNNRASCFCNAISKQDRILGGSVAFRIWFGGWVAIHSIQGRFRRYEILFTFDPLEWQIWINSPRSWKWLVSPGKTSSRSWTVLRWGSFTRGGSKYQRHSLLLSACYFAF